MKSWLRWLKGVMGMVLAVIILIVTIPLVSHLLEKYAVDWAKLTRRKKIILAGMTIWFYAMLILLVYLIISALWRFLT